MKEDILAILEDYIIVYLGCYDYYDGICEKRVPTPSKTTAKEEKDPTFSKGQRRIASYITESYDKAAFMTASRLGTMVGVSESTVVRFAVELGYDGYPEMQKALQENSATSLPLFSAENV